MPIRKDITASVAIALAVGCAAVPFPRGARGYSPSGAWFDWVTIRRTLDSCVPEPGDSYEELTCAFVDVRYPIVVMEDAERINDWIQRRLVGAFRNDTSEFTVQKAARAFLDAYAADMTARTYQSAWYLEGEVRVLHESPRLISLEMAVATYRGLSHAQTWRWLATFDVQSGSRLDLDDVLRPAGVTLVRTHLESAVTRRMSIASARDFEHDFHHWPKNFALGAGALLVHVNAYELGLSWADGPVAIEVPYADLGGLTEPPL